MQDVLTRVVGRVIEPSIGKDGFENWCGYCP